MNRATNKIASEPASAESANESASITSEARMTGLRRYRSERVCSSLLRRPTPVPLVLPGKVYHAAALFSGTFQLVSLLRDGLLGTLEKYFVPVWYSVIDTCSKLDPNTYACTLYREKPSHRMTHIFSDRTIDEYLIGWTRNHHLPKTSYNLVGPLFHVHFDQPFKGTTNDFFFTNESTPDQVTQAIKRSQQNLSHWLTVFCNEEQVREMVHVYERLGYQFKSQETLMAKPLTSENEVNHPATFSNAIEATCTRESDSWAQAFSRGISVSLAPFLDVVHWHYILVHDERQVAKGAWIMTPEHSAYIDDVETEAAYRRRGFAETLMQRMLCDAVAAEAVESVLSASHMGKPLYQKLGYAEQAVILVLTKHEKEPT
jgi:ribosomal protein S18 acetylase RimI-like enzyme